VRWLPLLILLSGCAVGRYAATPEYKLPETRTIAARQLNDALTSAGIGVSEVVANEVLLTWHERHQLTDKRWVMLEREMILLQVKSVARPVRVGELYELRVEGAGGQVTFEFTSGRASAAAEAALWRLLRPLNTDERNELGKKYYRYLEKGSPAQPAASRPEDSSSTNASGSLRAMTGRNYGNDLQAWLKFLTEEWYLQPAGE
jgi:hypothetical protein